MQDGGTPGLGPLFVRNVFRMIDSLPMCYGLGLLMILTSTRQARLGDLAAGTIVVYDTATNRNALRTEDLLSNTKAEPQVLLLVDELLRRWKELQPAPRVQLARKLLERAGRPVPDGDERLEAALQMLKAGQ